MITEIQNFRKKYPEYNDLDDLTLANKLAAKYPEYSDLPAKVKNDIPTSTRSSMQNATISPEMQEYIDSLSPTQKFFIGVGKGMTDIYTGVKQLGAELGEHIGIISPDTTKNIRETVKANRELYAPLSKQSTAAKIGEFVGQTAPTLVIPGGVTGGVVKRAVTSGISGGVVGALQPTTKEDSRLTNILTGATSGAAVSSLVSGGGKVINAFLGKVPPNEVRAAGQKYGIRTTLGEETGNPITQQAESWLEKVPVIGLKKFRVKQQIEAENAAKRWFSDYVTDPSNVESLNIAREANRDYVKGLYTKMKELVSDVGEQKISPINTRRTANELLDRYPDIFKTLQDTKTERILKNITSGLKDTKATSDILMNTDMSKKITFDELWTLRDGIGEKVGQAKKLFSRGDVDRTQLSQLSALYAAINKDLDNWTRQIGKPEIREAVKTANDAYKQYVVRFDILDDLLAKATGEKGAGEMFSPKKLSTDLKNLAWKQQKLKDFTPQQIDEMTGLANIMQIVKRAGQYAENPPTGNRWGTPVVTALAGLKTVPYILTGKFLTGTTAGKNLVRAASKIEPTSPAMGNIINRLYREMSKAPANIMGINEQNDLSEVK